jgi:hypothetical protein
VRGEEAGQVPGGQQEAVKIGGRDDRRRSRDAAQERDFAEHVARTDRAHDHAVDRHAGDTFEDDVEGAAGGALVDDHVPFRISAFSTLGRKPTQIGPANRGEQRRPREPLLQPVLSVPGKHNWFNAGSGLLVPHQLFGLGTALMFGVPTTQGAGGGCLLTGPVMAMMTK